MDDTRDLTVEAEEATPAWDDFVDRAPGGDHVQTSRWGQVKRVVGWRARRAVARHRGEIVGGCQVLIRDLPVLGAVGYVPRGPLLADGDARTLERVLEGIDEIASVEGLISVTVQPPAGGEHAIPALEERGYLPSEIDVAPVATVRVDLRRDEDEILAAMRSGHRANVRKAPRKGVTVRAGAAADLPAYMEVVRATAARQGFPLYPAEYYEAMLRAFAPGDHVRLVVAEHEEKVVSAVLVLAYGEGAMYKMGGWRGEPRSIHPNELAHWEAIRWARGRGCRYYDFEGVSPSFARALHAGLEPEPPRGDSRFKLGFGGEVILLPGAYQLVYRPLRARLMRRAAALRGTPAQVADRLLGRTRG